MPYQFIMRPPFPARPRGALANGLVAAWTFHEGRRATVRNAITRAGDGTIVGTPNYGAGSHGWRLNLDGATQYVTAPRLSTIPLISQPWSIVMVVTTTFNTSGAFPRAINWYDGASNVEIGVDGNVSGLTQGFYVAATGGTALIAGSQLTYALNTTRVICATFDGSNCRLYVDGKDDSANTSGYAGLTNPNTNTSTIFLGVRGDLLRPWPGSISLAMIYNMPLYQDSVSLLAMDPFLPFRPPSRLGTRTYVSAPGAPSQGQIIYGTF